MSSVHRSHESSPTPETRWASGNDSHQPRWRRRPDARPHEILDAAFQVFGDHGLAATRLEDVARRAGVSKGTIYLYFDSKEALFREVVRVKIISVIEEAERIVDPGQDPLDALRSFAHSHWAFVTGQDFQTIYRLVNSELARFPDLARFYGQEVIQRSVNLLSAILSRGMERGVLRCTDPVAAARIFGSMFTTHAVWFVRREHFGTFANESSESVRDGLVDFYLQALTTPRISVTSNI